MREFVAQDQMEIVSSGLWRLLILKRYLAVFDFVDTMRNKIQKIREKGAFTLQNALYVEI